VATSLNLRNENKSGQPRYENAEPLGVVEPDGTRRKIEGQDLKLYFEQAGGR
jgi:hypothetical protein